MKAPTIDGRRMRSKARLPLLVEDDPDQLSLLTMAFQEAGVGGLPAVFPSGEAAVEFLSSDGSYRTLDPVRPFSFALLDVDLPGMSGLEVLEWMTTSERLRNVPVIMLSASTDPERVERAFRLGAKSYLLKPGGFSSLVRLIEGVARFWDGPLDS
jgi:CheY-like chemotaxis protein